ncbi:LOW QUALITY PROTEIN: BRICHOS domain-containing protein 5, partial [Acridotheres tristis]
LPWQKDRRASQDRRATAHFPAPSRTFWIILSVALLLFAVVGISVVGVLSFSPSSAQVRDPDLGRNPPPACSPELCGKQFPGGMVGLDQSWAMQEGAGGAGTCQRLGVPWSFPPAPAAFGMMGLRMESWIILPVGQSLLLCTAESDKEQGPARGQPGMLLVGDTAHISTEPDGGCCPPTPHAQAGSQLVRVTLQDQQDLLRNQTAVVDKARSTITYYITSQSNLSAVVLYDSRNGYVCYKPLEQRACYLRRMDPWDVQTLQTPLNSSEHTVSSCCSTPGTAGAWIELCTGSLNVLPHLLQHNNQTKFYREFLGIVAGEQVEPRGLGEAVQTLCEHTSIFWVQRGQGPGRQRLIYLCIDICFPSNICVSICFYYLPE